MKRLILVGVLLLSMAPLTYGQSNLYKMRNGASVTPMGQELILSTNTLCNEFMRIQGHFNAMTQQRNASDDFTQVATQWGVLDAATNAESEPVAEALYTELNSMIGNTQAAVLQFCARVKQ